MAYDKQPLDDTSAIKQLWQKVLKLKNKDSDIDTSIADIYIRLENLARQLYGTSNPNRNITVNNDTDAGYATEAGNSDTVDNKHSSDFQNIIWLDRTILNYTGSTVEAGYFILDSTSAASFDIIIQCEDAGHEFSAKCSVEEIADSSEASDEWMMVPATAMKLPNGADDLIEEFIAEIKVTLAELRIRICKKDSILHSTD